MRPVPASRPRLSPTGPLARFVGAFTLATATACGGGDQTVAATGENGGTLIVAVPAEPSTLFPPQIIGTQGGAVVSAIFDKLADIGPALETNGDAGFQKRLATSWTWAPDSLSIAFVIDSGAHWHDGKPVRAADVAYTFRVYTDDSVGASYRSLLGNIDSVTVRDERTVEYWFKRRMPQQFYDATYNMYILPSHLLDSIPMAQLGRSAFARNPVGTGRFRFARWEPGQRIEVVADTTNARGRAKLDRVIWSITPDLGAATVKLFAGEADFLETISLENVAQVAQSPSLRMVLNPALNYNFVAFNQRDPADNSKPHPVFGDSLVRRALAMAVDRRALVKNVLDSLGRVSFGPAPRALMPDTAAFTQLPYDVARAKALLDSAGWRDSNNDGVRDKNGRELAFEIFVPVSSMTRQRFAVLLQEQYRAVGVKATPVLLEINALQERIPEKRFDSYLGGIAASPGLVGVRQSWMTDGESNEVKYSSRAFDAFADSALSSFDAAQSRRLWARAFQQAVNDAPVLWLFEPQTPVVLHKRFIVPSLRADGWYSDLADWRVDPTQRIDRDRIGLVPAGGAR
jgi:peptide/nickel transport system substrate-binding protein